MSAWCSEALRSKEECHNSRTLSGNLYGMDVSVTTALAEDEGIAFNAGSHTELIRLAYLDFERLVQPKVLRFERVI